MTTGKGLVQPEDPGSSGVSDVPEGSRLASVRASLSLAPRILIVKLRSLGDSILSLPVVDALHEWRPDLQVDVLAETPFAAVYAHHPAVHEVLVLKPRNWPARSGWSRTRTFLEVRKRHYPITINLHGGTTSLLFSLASGARCRIGFEYYRNSWGYNIRIPASTLVWGRKDLHTVEHLLAPLLWLGIPFPEPPCCRLYLDESACARVRERLDRSGIRRGGYLQIHPTATLATKQWPPELFAQLADRLQEHYSLPVIFTSAGTEAQTLLDIGQRAAGIHQYWSDLNLDELFALIEGCRLFIGNDSGPTHAAAALEKPVVAVWGSSNYRAWHPWGTDFELVRSDLPCMPCPGYTCSAYGKPKCILDIPVEKVLEASYRLLART